MPTLREDLEKSRDSWQESAEHDLRQAWFSLAIAGTGAAADGVGLMETFVEKQPTIGVLTLVVGTGMLIAGVRMARGEIRDAMAMQGKAAVQQHKIDRLGK